MADKLTIETCKTVKDYLDNFVPDGAFVQINDAMNVDVDGHLVYSGEKENVPQKLMERLLDKNLKAQHLVFPNLKYEDGIYYIYLEPPVGKERCLHDSHRILGRPGWTLSGSYFKE